MGAASGEDAADDRVPRARGVVPACVHAPGCGGQGGKCHAEERASMFRFAYMFSMFAFALLVLPFTAMSGGTRRRPTRGRSAASCLRQGIARGDAPRPRRSAPVEPCPDTVRWQAPSHTRGSSPWAACRAGVRHRRLPMPARPHRRLRRPHRPRRKRSSERAAAVFRHRRLRRALLRRRVRLHRRRRQPHATRARVPEALVVRVQGHAHRARSHAARGARVRRLPAHADALVAVRGDGRVLRARARRPSQPPSHWRSSRASRPKRCCC